MKPSHDLAISVRDLHVRYQGAHALDGVTLAIPSGSFVLIGGRSGSGKSTLARTLLGLVREDALGAAHVSGEVAVAGRSSRLHTTAELATHAGLVFQNPTTQLFNGTVEEEVAFGPRNLGHGGEDVDRRVAYALRAVDAEHLRARSVRRLSGGEQQRVAVASALAMRPSILILDEPTANLDPRGTASVVRALARLHREWAITVVVIEHRLAPFVPYAERVIWLEHGTVVDDGEPERVLRDWQPELLFGAPQSAAGDPLVDLKHVTLGYNGRLVLRDCSLTLHKGELAALVGPNGSGKSTLARVLAGLERPWEGDVLWHGGRPTRSSVGFLQQNPLHQLICSTVGDEVSFGPANLKLREHRWVEELLEHTGLRELRQRPTQALSVGEQQRTALAATVSLRPQLLILDEPTIGQDRDHLRQLMSLVRAFSEQGQTVLLITHDRELVEGCASCLWELSQGRACERKMNKSQGTDGPEEQLAVP